MQPVWLSLQMGSAVISGGVHDWGAVGVMQVAGAASLPLVPPSPGAASSRPASFERVEPSFVVEGPLEWTPASQVKLLVVEQAASPTAASNAAARSAHDQSALTSARRALTPAMW